MGCSARRWRNGAGESKGERQGRGFLRKHLPIVLSAGLLLLAVPLLGLPGAAASSATPSGPTALSGAAAAAFTLPSDVVPVWSTINQYLAACLIDELRLHISPLTLGAGTRLFEGVPPLKLEQVKSRAASLVTHVTYRVLS